MLALATCRGPLTVSRAERACRTLRFETSLFTVCAARPGRHRIALVDEGSDGRPLRDFAGVADRLGNPPRIAFAMNAGMFDAAGRPIGLYDESGRERHLLNQANGSGNFYLVPNGVFYGDAGGWHLLPTPAFAQARPAGLRFATQSGPMLVIDGQANPVLAANGASLFRRNGVGIDADGAAWFAISDEPVSFGRFARLFRDRLGCRDALYLDGAVSRLWDPVSGRIDGGPKIGPIVVVLETG